MTSAQTAEKPKAARKEPKYAKSVAVELGDWSGAGPPPEINITFHGLWSQQDMNYVQRHLNVAFQERKIQQWRDLDTGKEID